MANIAATSSGKSTAKCTLDFIPSIYPPIPLRTSRFASSHIRPDSTNRFIRAHGDIALVWQALRCSCATDGDSTRPNPMCLICHGTGYAYTKAPTYERGVASSITSNKQMQDSGIGMPGDLVFVQATRGNHRQLADWDILLFTGWSVGQIYEGDILTRGGSNGNITTDTLVYQATDIHGVAQHNPNTGITTEWQENIDFTVLRNIHDALNGSQIIWSAGRGPALGTVYSISYSAIYAWIVFNPPTARIERNTSLGQHVVLRKRHIALGSLN